MEAIRTNKTTYGGLLPASSSPPLPTRTTNAAGILVLRWPSQWPRGRRVRCAHCGARVLVNEPPSADVPRVDVTCLACSRVCVELLSDTSVEWDAQTGRARREQSTGDRCPKRTVACPSCGSRQIQPHREKCQDCESERRVRESVPMRLVAALADAGAPLTMAELVAALGVSEDSIRQAVKKARMAGYPIALRRTTYVYRDRSRVVLTRQSYRLEPTEVRP